MSIQRIIGPFEVYDRIGVGGMGIVYRGKYTKTGLPVAIKLLAPDLNNEEGLLKRFDREVAILKKLKHPNIVRYYASGKVGMQRFYAMELVTGGSLEGKLAKQRKFQWPDAVNYTLQIARALQYAHEAGVIHRDLKPANLLLGSDGVLKLTDFGIARDTTATALTAAGRTVGTYAYMAPEQIRGKPPVDRRTDLYALGCVLFEMLTGATPFESENGGELLMMHMNEEPPRISSIEPSVPEWLEELIFDLLEKDMEKRPYDALALETRLEELVAAAANPSAVTKDAVDQGPTVLNVSTVKTAQGEAAKPKKKKRKAETGPFYERLWFLVLCFVMLVGAVTWSLRPLSAAQLLAKGNELLKSDDDVNWIDARDKFLKPLIQRYPQSPEAATAREKVDEVELHFLEIQIRKKVKLQMEPGNEAERLVMEAIRFEGFGDRLSALEKYRSIVELLKNREQDRVYLLLARRQAAAIEDSGEALDRVELVQQALERADRLFLEGQTLEAHKVWNSLILLYAANQELEPQVKRARGRLAGKMDVRDESPPTDNNDSPQRSE